MKRIPLHQGLAPLEAAILCKQGWDAVHVSEISLDRADDTDILEAARLSERTCVTLDHDFHSHLAAKESQQALGRAVTSPET